MKTMFSLICVITMATCGFNAQAQSITNYEFSAAEGPALLLQNPINVPLSGGNANEGWFNGIPIGFTFYYMGKPYTSVSASTNGWMTFGQAIFNAFPLNDLDSGATRPVIAPLWDDLDIQEDTNFGYITTGVLPNRIFSAEWRDVKWNPQATGAVISFQVKLFETTGVIQFVYIDEDGTVNNGSASIGITGEGKGPGNFLSLDNSSPFPNVSSTSETTSISIKPANGQNFTWGPACNVINQNPVDIYVTNVTKSSMTVNWFDNSSLETYFVVQQSGDGGITYLESNAVPSTTTVGTGELYSLAVTGLIPGKTYHFRITANNEASPPSPFLHGSQATDPPGAVISASSGLWNAPSTWAGGVIPTATDNVTIAAGHLVTINADGDCNDLNVQGTGILQFGAATARTLTVAQHVTVETGGVFRSATSGTVTDHTVVIGGNFTNNGTVNFSTNSNLAGAKLIFNGREDYTFDTGASSPTEFRENGLILNMSDPGNTLTFNAVGQVTVEGVNTKGFLQIVSGIFKLAGSTTFSNPLFGAPNYTISSEGGFWLDNPNATIIGRNASSVNNGLFRITAGTFNVGNSAGNSMGAGPGARFEIQGGIINIAGRLNAENPVIYQHSGGVVNITTVGNAATGLAGFGLTNPGSSFMMSGGSINIVKASTGLQGIDYDNEVTDPSITGGLLTLGTAASGAAQNFRINGHTPNIFVDSFDVQVTQIGDLVVHGDLSIASGSEFDVTNSFTIDIITNTLGMDASHPGNIYNYGTMTLSESTLAFTGSFGAQSITNNGTITGNAVGGLSVDNQAGVILNTPLSCSSLNLLNGSLNTTNTNILTLTGNVPEAVIRVNGKVSGPMEWVLPPGIANWPGRLFPLGKETDYTPVELIDPQTNSGGPVVIRAEVFNEGFAGTPGTNMSALENDRYWKMEIVSGAQNFTGTKLRYSNNPNLPAITGVGKATALNGSYDLVSSAIPEGNTITTNTLTGFSYFALGTKALNMAYVSSITTQTVTSDVLAGQTDRQIIGIKIETAGNLNPLSVTSFTFNTNGSSNPAGDIASAKLYYTGNSSSFTLDTQYTIPYQAPNGQFVITGTQVLLDGPNFFWLALDIPPGATEGNVVDAACTSVTVAGIPYMPAAQAPQGSRTIRVPLAGTVNVGTGQAYPSLTNSGGLFEKINSHGLSGNLIAIITSDLAESGDNALNQWAETGAGGYTLTIKPDAAVERIITGASNHLIDFDGADSTTIDGRYNGSGNYLRFRNTNPGYATIRFINGASNNTVRNCHIEGCTQSNSMGVVFFDAGENSHNEIMESLIKGSLDTDPGQQFEIYLGSAGNSNNTISNTIITDIVYCGIYIREAANTTVEHCEIIMNETGVQSYSISGIRMEDAPGTKILRNKINYLGEFEDYRFWIRGIVSSGERDDSLIVSIENNVISLAPDSDGEVVGIDYKGFDSNSLNIYYNSIYIGGSLTGGSAGSACIRFTGKAANINMINNILQNARVNTVGSVPHESLITNHERDDSLQVSVGMDFNTYFVSEQGGPLFNYQGDYIGILTDWQAATGQDANSLVVDPQFISATNLQPQLDSPVLGAGIPLTTDNEYDITLQLRSATNPSMGAYEMGVDSAGPAISYTPLVNTSLTGNRPFDNIIISDPNGVNSNPGNRPRVYYKKAANANAFIDNTAASDGWKWAEATGSSSPFNFIIDYSKLYGGAGVTTGDIVQYFVVAQDLQPTPLVSINAGTFATTPASVALFQSAYPIGGTINSYMIAQTFAGIINVGYQQTYTSLTADGPGGLFKALNNGVLTGNLIVNLVSDLSETGEIALNQLTDDGLFQFIVTIKPDSPTLRTISGNCQGGLIRLSGCDRVTFDGHYGADTTTNYLTITNMATSGTFAAIMVKGGSEMITIKNCNISTGSKTAPGGYCFICDPGWGYEISPDLTIEHCKIFNAYTGLRINDENDTVPIVIRENTFGSADTSISLGNVGVSLANCSVSFTGNEILNLQTGNHPTGLKIGPGVVNSTFSRNKIHGIRYIGQGGFGGTGIDINTLDSNSNVQLDNNLLYDISGKGWHDPATNGIAGISLSSETGGIRLYYNSVHLTGTINRAAATGDKSAALSFWEDDTDWGVEILNNIFSNSIENTTGSATAYAITAGDLNGDGIFNHNDYYAAGPEGVLGYTPAEGDVITLAAWQAATGQDANSIDSDPLFISPANLHLQAGSPAIGKAVPLLAVPGDANGDGRHPFRPTIGAYEYPPSNFCLWTGLSNNAWGNPANWTPYGPPTINDEAGIPGNPASNPVVFPILPPGFTGNCDKLFLDPDAVLLIRTGALLNVKDTGQQ